MGLATNGTNQAITWASSVSNNADYSLLLRFKAASLTGARGLFCSDGGNVNERNTDTVFLNVGVVAYYFTDASGNQTLGGESALAALSTGVWYDLAVVRNGNTVTGYINGVEYFTGTASTSGRGAPTNMSVGAFHANAYKDWFSGSFDDIKIFTRALTLDEINASRAQRRPVSTESLYVWLPTINTVLAGALIDYSGNARNATGTGTPTITDGAPVGYAAVNTPFVRGANAASPVTITGVPCGIKSGSAVATIDAPNPAATVTGVPCGIRSGSAVATIDAPNSNVTITGVPCGIRIGSGIATIDAPYPVTINGVPCGIRSGSAVATISAPAGVAPSAPVLDLPVATSGQVALSWSVPAGSPTGYTVKIGTVVGVYPITVDVGNVTSYDVLGLTNGVIYNFVVEAYNAIGTSAVSNARIASPHTAPTGNLIRQSSANGRYFEKWNPTTSQYETVLATGAHIWWTIQEWNDRAWADPFDVNDYLDQLVEYGHNFTRVWIMDGIGFTDSPDTSDMPPSIWMRPGPGNALDGRPKFDLTLPNQEFYDRLRARVIAMQERGLITGVMFFNNGQHTTHPMAGANNINSINLTSANAIYSTSGTALTYQRAHIQKVIDTLHDLDNVVWEIVNEPFDDSAVKTWIAAQADWAANYEQTTYGEKHPMWLTAAYSGDNVWLDTANSNVQAIARQGYYTTTYKLGGFPATDGAKVDLWDTDHIYGLGGVALEIWQSFLRGYNPVFMDGLTENVYSQSIDAINLKWAMGSVLSYSRRMPMASVVPSASGYMLSGGGKYLRLFNGASSFTPANGTYSVEWFDIINRDAYTAADVVVTGSTTFTPPISGDVVLFLQPIGAVVSDGKWQTNVTDDFNRGSIGANWSAGRYGRQQLAITANQVSFPAPIAQSSWEVSQFTDFEFIFTYAALAAQDAYIGIEITKSFTAPVANYWAAFIKKSGTDVVEFYHSDGASDTSIGNMSVEFAAGDKFAVRKVGNVFTFARYDGAAWSVLGTFTDSTYTGPYSVSFWGDGSTARFDDMCVGAIPAAATLNAPTAGNQQVSLSWNTVAGASGYKVLTGTATGVYTASVDVGNVTSTVVSSLTNGQNYKFVVIPYNATNTHANLSNEVSATPTPGDVTVTGVGSGWKTAAAAATISAPNPPATVTGVPTGEKWGMGVATIDAPNPPATITGIGCAVRFGMAVATIVAVAANVTITGVPTGARIMANAATIDAPNPPATVTGVPCGLRISSGVPDISAPHPIDINPAPVAFIDRYASASVATGIAVTGVPTGVRIGANAATISAPNPEIVVTGVPTGMRVMAAPATVSAVAADVTVTGVPTGMRISSGVPVPSTDTAIVPGPAARIGTFGLTGAVVGENIQQVEITGPSRIILGTNAATISAPNPGVVITGPAAQIRQFTPPPTITQLGEVVTIQPPPMAMRIGSTAPEISAPNPDTIITWTPTAAARTVMGFSELQQSFTMSLTGPASVRIGANSPEIKSDKNGFFTFKYNNFGLNVGDEGAIIYTEGGMRTEWLRTLVHPQADPGKIYRSYSDKGVTVFEYYALRDLDGSGTNAWPAGASFVNTGKIDDGFIVQYANYGITRTGQAATSRRGPTMAGHVRVGNEAHEIEERWVIGALGGYYDYASSPPVYGFAAGDRESTWIGVDATRGIRMMHGAAKKAEIRTDGTWKFYGNGSQYIEWTGSTLIVAGQISVIAGSTVPWSTLTGVPGPGVNLLQNPTFESNRKGWNVGTYNGSAPASTQLQYGLNLSEPWTLANFTTLWARVEGGAGSSNYVEWGANVSDVKVTPGDFIEWSVYSGAHRCLVRAFVYWLDGAGNLIAFSGHPATADNWGEMPGGTTLSSYKRIWGIAVVPSGAVFARLMLRTMAPDVGHVDSYGFFVMPYVGRTTAGQTQPSPWAHSGTNGMFTAPFGDGLHLGPSYMGYYAGGYWRTYMDASGNFTFRGAPVANSAGIAWDAATGRLMGGFHAGANYAGFTEQWYTDAATGEIMAGAGRVKLSRYGVFGTDAIGKPAFSLISQNITVNGEPMAAGDALLGDNSTSTAKGNVFFDQDAGTLSIRVGLVNVLSFSSSSKIEGVLSIGADGGIWQGAEGSFSDPRTGLRIRKSFINNNGVIEMYNNGTRTFFMRGDTCMTIWGGTTYSAGAAINFIDTSSNRMGELYAHTDGSTKNVVSLRGYANSATIVPRSYLLSTNDSASGRMQAYMIASKVDDVTPAFGKPWAYVVAEARNDTNTGVAQMFTESTSESALIYITVTGTTSQSYILADTHIFTGTKTGFHIDHPLHPLTKTLSHTPVDGDKQYTFYAGEVTLDESGEATVEMPDWFTALNGHVTYHLTCMDEFAPVYVTEQRKHGKISGTHRFTIKGGKDGLRVCWQVTGIRHDPFATYNPFVVERDKDDEQRGSLIKGRARNRPDLTYKHKTPS